MNHFKILGIVLTVGLLYLGTVAFSPVSNQPSDKYITFETNDFAETKRVRDLLKGDNLLKLEELSKSALIRIRIRVKGKREGTEIEVEGGI
jgi:hypothetical protein